MSTLISKLKGLPFKQSGLVWLWLTMILVALDQWTKIWANTQLAPERFGPVIEVMPYFNLDLAYNYGAAWSSFSGQTLFLSSLAILISIMLVMWLWHTPKNHKLASIGLSMVLAGAIGNVYDRLSYGYVIDFIDWFAVWDGREHHWPTFNIADSVILIGVGLLLIDSFVNPEPKKNKTKK